MTGLLPALPAGVLGRTMPDRFRHASLRLADADRVLVDFIAWLEDGGDEAARELGVLVRAGEALRARLPSRALDAMLAGALPREAVPIAPRARPRPGFWPVLPAQVLGVPLPRRFRGLGVRFADADRVLVALVAWLEAKQPDAARRPDAAGARETLVRACIDLRERLGDSPLEVELRDLLRSVGVTEIVADGEPFDPERHRAAGTEPTTDQRLHDRVAATDRLGYHDHGRVLLVPEVIVYRAEPR